MQYHHHPPTWPYDQGHGLGIFMLKFYVKVFRTSLFPNLVMDLVHMWYDDRYWSKLLCSTITIPLHSLKVKVTDLDFFMSKFYIKVFRISLFPNLVMDLVHIWYDDRYWSKLLCSTIPPPLPPPNYLKVKVTDLDFLCKIFAFKIYNVSFCIALDGFDLW